MDSRTPSSQQHGLNDDDDDDDDFEDVDS